MCNVTEIHIERVTRAHWLSYHCSDVQLLEVLRMGRQGWRESWWGISPNWSWYWPVASVSASVFVLCSLKLSAYNLDFTKNVRGYRREDWAHSKVISASRWGRQRVCHLWVLEVSYNLKIANQRKCSLSVALEVPRADSSLCFTIHASVSIVCQLC